MRTTIKQQMTAIKKAMEARASIVTYSQLGWLPEYKTGPNKDTRYKALNDAYSSLASIALLQSVNKLALS